MALVAGDNRSLAGSKREANAREDPRPFRKLSEYTARRAVEDVAGKEDREPVVDPARKFQAHEAICIGQGIQPFGTQRVQVIVEVLLDPQRGDHVGAWADEFPVGRYVIDDQLDVDIGVERP